MIKNFVGETNNNVNHYENKYENEEEKQYLGLIKDILTKGSLENSRNGNTLSVFGAAMHFSLSDNKIPILTSKKVAWRTCLKELSWFIRGKTDNAILQSQNVHIWDGNASRNFLDSRGLINREENDLGPIYGHQWRHFNAQYSDCRADYTGQGIDQLQNIIDALRDPQQRNSRRLVMTAWNPCQLDEMAIPPCHVICQFNVSHGNKLSCALYQRSADVGLGMPFNIASYSFLTHILAKHCGLVASEFIYTLGNCHIYEDHIQRLKEQITRPTYAFPTIEILNSHENINDYKIEDFQIHNYNCGESIFMKMSA
jgi:thymidylate synthase